MLLAVLIFVAGNGKYKHEQPTGSPLERVADITWHACGHALRQCFCCGAQPEVVVTPRSTDVRPPRPPLSCTHPERSHSSHPASVPLAMTLFTCTTILLIVFVGYCCTWEPHALMPRSRS